eukprot:8626849-Alexandrium_andersonii.AAC.1
MPGPGIEAARPAPRPPAAQLHLQIADALLRDLAGFREISASCSTSDQSPSLTHHRWLRPPCSG